MTNVHTGNPINWRNVTCFTIVVVTAVAATILAPIWAHQLQLTNRERQSQSQSLIALPNQGLSTCTEMGFDYYDDVEQFIDAPLNGKPQVSITVLPSFAPEWGVRLIKNDVYLVRLESSLWGQSVPELTGGNNQHSSAPTQITTHISHAIVTNGTALRLKQLFTKSIVHAQETPTLGVDGVSYRFRAPGVGCGKTWSPDPATRAGQLVEMIDLLSAHAQLTDSHELTRSERNINRLLYMLRTP